jgi:hypothetical protein
MGANHSEVPGVGERAFSDDRYKKFVLDRGNSRIYRRRIDLAGTLYKVGGAAPGGARAARPQAFCRGFRGMAEIGSHRRHIHEHSTLRKAHE